MVKLANEGYFSVRLSNAHNWRINTESSLIIPQIIIGGFAEVVSLAYICVVMVTILEIEHNVSVLLMGGIFLIPALWQAIKARAVYQTRAGKIRIVLFIVAVFCALEGIVVLSFKVKMSFRVVTCCVVFCRAELCRELS